MKQPSGGVGAVKADWRLTRVGPRSQQKRASFLRKDDQSPQKPCCAIILGDDLPGTRNTQLPLRELK